MPFVKGMKKDPRSGIKKGQFTKKTLALREIVQELGCSPVSVLVHIAMANEKALGHSGPRIRVLKDGGVIEEPWITDEMRLRASEILLKYMYPQLKAVEHSGSVDSVVTASSVTKERLLEAIKTDPFLVVGDETDKSDDE
jgi:hypothetical protein